MRNVSDIIEQYLKHILLESSEGVIEIQRNELADKFQCVPSQINYVISTRFSIEKGYLVESKRGGGGYIRIQKIELTTQGEIHQHILQTIGTNMDQTAAEGLIFQLEEARFITRREANLLKSAVSRDVLVFKLPFRDEFRASLLRNMLISLLK